MTYAVEPVVDYIRTLQARFIEELCKVDSGLKFVGDMIEGERGTSRPRVAEGGLHFDKVAVQFTHSIGQRLPPAATERKPELANTPFQAAAISWIFHPKSLCSNNTWEPAFLYRGNQRRTAMLVWGRH